MGRRYEFHIIVHEAEEGGYWGEVIELPGCMSQGETEADLRANLRGAIDAVLASYAADGEQPPLEPVRTETLAVPLPA
ncbi:MAG TPA: type II toxin-antitoxin system HicB family antitoxin [Dehalococcoidia bacterium]|nr:type II toxin-antitoxin system HicB family antitoxin [Dehalococcoidia bacterium]